MKKKKQPVAVRIETVRQGMPYPFSPAFNRDDAQEFMATLLGIEADDETDGADGIDLTDEPNGTAGPETETETETETENGTEKQTDGEDESEPERSSFFAAGHLVETGDRVEIVYEESVVTGMEGSVTSIGFSRSDPSVVTMFRKGFVNTAFVFEQGVRHICVYQTPIAEFELCVHALAVRNAVLTDGILELDYLTELHGARTERTRMTVRIEPPIRAV